MASFEANCALSPFCIALSNTFSNINTPLLPVWARRSASCGRVCQTEHVRYQHDAAGGTHRPSVHSPNVNQLFMWQWGMRRRDPSQKSLQGFLMRKYLGENPHKECVRLNIEGCNHHKCHLKCSKLATEDFIISKRLQEIEHFRAVPNRRSTWRFLGTLNCTELSSHKYFYSCVWSRTLG